MTRFAPSHIWFRLIAVLWKRVLLRDRFVVIAYFVMPAVNRLTTVASFAIAVRAFTRAIHAPLSPSSELLFAGAIFIVFLLSEFTDVVMSTVQGAIQRICLALARGVRVDVLIQTRGKTKPLLPDRVDGDDSETIEEEGQEKGNSITKGDTVDKMSNLLQSLIRFMSQILLILALLLVIMWISPVVSLSLMGGGMALLLFMRLRIRGDERSETEEQKEAQEYLLKLEERLCNAKEVTDVDRYNYIENRYDQIRFAKAKTNRARRGKIMSLNGLGVASAMVAIFILASQGFLTGVDPALAVVLILSLRMCTSQGRVAFELWSALLSERELLGDLRKALEQSDCAEHRIDLIKKRGE